MIQATVLKDSRDSGNVLYRGIVIEGHAGYAEEGEDIICAAVSALAINFYNSVEKSQHLMNSLILGLQNIEKDYGRTYIIIRFKEV